MLLDFMCRAGAAGNVLVYYGGGGGSSRARPTHFSFPFTEFAECPAQRLLV